MAKEKFVKTISQIKLEIEYHEWCILKSNKLGITINEFIAEQIKTLALNDAPPNLDDLSLDEKLLYNALKSRKRKYQLDCLYICQAMWLEEPTEENAATLKEQCNILEVDYDFTIKQAQSGAFKMLIDDEKRSPKFKSCIKWLVEFLESGDKKYEDIMAGGKENSFSEDMIKRAKKESTNGYLIDSYRSSLCWVWTLKKTEEEEEEEEGDIRKKRTKNPLVRQSEV